MHDIYLFDIGIINSYLTIHSKINGYKPTTIYLSIYVRIDQFEYFCGLWSSNKTKLLSLAPCILSFLVDHSPAYIGCSGPHMASWIAIAKSFLIGILLVTNNY